VLDILTNISWFDELCFLLKCFCSKSKIELLAVMYNISGLCYENDTRLFVRFYYRQFIVNLK